MNDVNQSTPIENIEYGRKLHEIARQIYTSVAEGLAPLPVEFSGILKVRPMQSQQDEICRLLGELVSCPDKFLDFKPIPIPRDKWHVTLIHQSFLKPVKEEIKKFAEETAYRQTEKHYEGIRWVEEKYANTHKHGCPFPQLKYEIQERHDEEQGRHSWVLYVTNQEDLRKYVNFVMNHLGLPRDPEPGRVFHLSIANLTGNPGDSVR